MTTDESRALAEQLTGAVLALDGVRAVFPERPVLATVLSLVTPGSGAPQGVRVLAEPDRVAARIAVARTTPSRTVIEAIAAAAAEATGGPCPVEIEIAAID